MDYGDLAHLPPGVVAELTSLPSRIHSASPSRQLRRESNAQHPWKEQTPEHGGDEVLLVDPLTATAQARGFPQMVVRGCFLPDEGRMSSFGRVRHWKKRKLKAKALGFASLYTGGNPD